MGKSIKKNWVFYCVVAILVFPFIVLACAKFFFAKNIFDNADFWYGYMAYFGSVILAGVAMQQSKASAELSHKFDVMNASQNYSFARATGASSIERTYHIDKRITLMNRNEQNDSTILLIEAATNIDVERNNQYDFDLTFDDLSKAAIKEFRVVANQTACMQDPDENGLTWSDYSSDFIQVGFIAAPLGDVTYPFWTKENQFKVHVRIYAPDNKVFSAMMENNIPLCFVLPVELESVCGVVTEMKFRYWLKKNYGQIAVENMDSRLLNVREAKTNAD